MQRAFAWIYFNPLYFSDMSMEEKLEHLLSFLDSVDSSASICSSCGYSSSSSQPFSTGASLLLIWLDPLYSLLLWLNKTYDTLWLHYHFQLLSYLIQSSHSFWSINFHYDYWKGLRKGHFKDIALTMQIMYFKAEHNKKKVFTIEINNLFKAYDFKSLIFLGLKMIDSYIFNY